MSSNAKIIMSMGRTSSKMKLFQSRLITLKRFMKVALKWIQNWVHVPY